MITLPFDTPFEGLVSVFFPYALQVSAENGGNPGVPTGIRTPVATVKGLCPRPLDDGDSMHPSSTAGRGPLLDLVEPDGIEPSTSCMPCKRSPS